MRNRFWILLITMLSATGYALDVKINFRNNEINPPGIKWKWRSENQMVLYDDDASIMKSALMLTRGDPKIFSGGVVIAFDKPVTANEDFSIAFDLMRLDDNSSVGVLTNEYKYDIRIYIAPNGNVALWNRDGHYEYSKIRLTPNIKYHLVGKYLREAGIFTLEIEGFRNFSVNVNPDFPISAVTLAPADPVGNRVLLDNFEFKSFPSKIVSRENALAGTFAELADGTKTIELTDGDLHKAIAIPVDSTVMFNLPERVEATGIQIFGGNPVTRYYPSGDCSPLSYVIEGHSNGAWVELAKYNKEQQKSSVEDLPENVFLRHDFKNIPIDLLRIHFTGTNDTGLRIGKSQALLPENRSISLREIQLFSSKEKVHKINVLDLVKMEYRLPVYRNQKNAELTITLVDDERAPDSGKLTLHRPDGTVVFSKTIKFSKGTQTELIQGIDQFANGRYLTTMEIGNYKLERLLRIDHIPEKPETPSEPLQMTGKKFYFTPDDYSIKSSKNLMAESFPTEKIYSLVKSAPGKLFLTLRSFSQDDAGRFILEVNEHDYKGFNSGNMSQRILMSKQLTGPYCETGETPPPVRKSLHYQLSNSFRPEIKREARPPEGTKYQLYDPVRDGKIPLSSIHTIFSYRPENYGCLSAPARTHWSVGKTSDGRWVMMNSKPILTDQWLYMENEMDDGRQSNDNSGGQWRSWVNDDELLWAIAQTVKRSAPYAVSYDNLTTSFRILAIYGTKDGIDWKFHNYLTLPDEHDSTGAQHYGGAPIQLANGDLMLYQQLAYDAEAQQVYLELVYSRDGIRFYRFPGQRKLIRSSNPDDSHFGYIYPYPYVRDGEKLYQLLHTTSCPHFFPEVLMLHENQKDISADSFRKRYGSRGMANRLPYFKSIGGWDGLAEYARRASYSISLMEMRFDGWFGLIAGGTEGNFETRQITASGTMSANAAIAPDGFIELTVRDKCGNELMKKRLSGDGCELPVFDLLPVGVFYIHGRMGNAILYTLNFSTK